MTTPASFNSPARIIEYAMKDAGLLQRGDAPDSDQYAEYSSRLLDLINYWQTKGLKLWLQRDLAIPLVASQGTYTLSLTGNVVVAKPLRVLQAYTLNTNGTKRPLTMISRDEYTRLSNVSQTGAINSLFVDKQQSILSLTFWQVPDATSALETAHVITQYQVTNFTTLTEGIEFPQEWFIALRWGLADDICSGQPKDIIDRCRLRAKEFFEALEDWDVEDASTFFQPDNRATSNSQGFR